MSERKLAASRRQAQASDPGRSVFVSANAGAGKTRVLVHRVIRLMLAGTPPERILCLTYTRAAAAEMARRLFDTLADWLPLDDDKLIDELHAICGEAKFGGDLRDARRLFTRAMETPGGLKIQTIHAFCERLLQRFPVEAGVVPGFEVMDEQATQDLLAAAQAHVMQAARDEPHGLEAQALAAISPLVSQPAFDKLLRELIQQRHRLGLTLDAQGVFPGTLPRLRACLGLEHEESEVVIAHRARSELDRKAAQRAMLILDDFGRKTNTDQAVLLRDALDAADDEVCFNLLKRLVLTSAEKPKAASKLMTQKARDAHPDVARFLDDEQARILELVDRARSMRVYAATASLLVLAGNIVRHYDELKRRRGACDYDDLIDRSLALLKDARDATWVLYRLDGGLDHILIDEAQDTSPQQWQIVARLAEDFFAGASARSDTARTVFAVGDPKQSIYSFQGADPEEFERMRGHFRRRVERAEREFRSVPFSVSFRSTPEILRAVDLVFSQAPASAGVHEAADALVHQAVRERDPGLIEIWPLERREDSRQRDKWRAPVGIDATEHPRLVLAGKIARRIRHWVDAREMLPAPQARPVRYGDILILLRNRTTFMDALVRALKLEGIPVAGADRLILARHIAVEDLMALARFVLLPLDDLTCACVLKGPLVERDDGRPIDDDDLFALCHDRGLRALWQCVQQAGDGAKPYRCAVERLGRWQAEAGFAAPFDFFCNVLFRDGGLKALSARLGTEAVEPVEAFLSLTLDFEREHAPSLRGFLTWMERTQTELKREMEHQQDEVRVMTVHGAKGLESPIVILPDTCDLPDGRTEPGIFYDEGADGEAIPMWKITSGELPQRTQMLRELHTKRTMQEYNRLLYVAMTRARDRLYIAGYTIHKELKPHCWYDMVANALKDQALPVHDTEGEIACWRMQGDAGAPAAPAPTPAAGAGGTMDEPEWLHEPAPAEASPERWRSPTELADATGAALGEPVLSPLDQGDTEPLGPATGFRRGNLIHTVLQFVPELEPAEREPSIRHYLAQPGHQLDRQAQQDIAAELLAILDDPKLSRFFSRDGRSEVPVVATLERRAGHGADAVPVSGRIDRLVVGPHEVSILDYKTNRPVPKATEDIHPLYVRQMALYSRALAMIYPDRAIRAALLWTAGPRLMDVPPELMQRSLAEAGFT